MTLEDNGTEPGLEALGAEASRQVPEDFGPEFGSATLHR